VQTTITVAAKDASDAVIEAIPDQTYTGSAIKPDLKITVNENELVSGTDYTATYSSNTNVGTARVKITFKLNYKGSASTTFNIVKAEKAQTITGTSSYTKTYGDAAFTLDAKNTTSGGTKLTYTSSDQSVATVSSTGKVTILKAGKTTITVKAAAADGYKAASKTVSVTVNAKSVTSATVSAIADKVYTGSAIKPAVTVKSGSTTLKSGTDYTVAYSNNKAIGKATVKITGKGNYTGTVTKTFNIVPKTPTVYTSTTTTLNSVKLSWKKVSGATGYRVYRYNSSAKTWKAIADVTSTSYTNKSLSAATKYSYKVAAYKTVSGTKYLSGKSSTISTATAPKKVTIKSTSSTKKSVTIKWNKVSCDGYKVYKYNTSTKKYTLVSTLGSSKTSYTLSGLKSSTSYKLKVCAFTKDSAGKIHAGSFSAVKTVKTK
jgi:hypothetical protein